MTGIDEVKSKVSSSNGSGPVTLVNVNVCPLTTNDALSPSANPLIGLESTLYSVVPCGQGPRRAGRVAQDNRAAPDETDAEKSDSEDHLRTSFGA